MRLDNVRPGKIALLAMFVTVVVAAYFAAAVNSANDPIVINGIAVPPVPTLDSDSVALGEALYGQHCASCHGKNLEGAPNWKTPLADGSFPSPPHDSSGHTWHHSDALILKIVVNGGDPAAPSTMPAFEDRLSQAQMVAILDFIKSRWGEKEREFQWWITQTSNGQ